MPVWPDELQEFGNISSQLRVSWCLKHPSPRFLGPLPACSLCLLCFLLVRHSLPGLLLPFPTFLVTSFWVASASPCPQAGPAVVLGCVIMGTFLNLSEPVSSLVKFTFSLTEHLTVRQALH